MSDQDFEGKSIYLKKHDDIVGVHCTGFSTDQGFEQMEAWVNAYDKEYLFLGSIYRVFGPIEQEAEALKQDGWVEVPAPPEEKEE